VNNLPVVDEERSHHDGLMVRMIPLAIALLVSACEASIGGGGGAVTNGPDASTTTTTPDATTTTTTPDAAAPRCSGRVVYLNFEGATLTRGAPSDAAANRASWIGVTTATVPRYRSGASDRAAQIQAITNRITSALASYPITVTQQRPATGQYVMVVFGGTRDDVGSNYSYATSFHDCGDAVKNDVAWLSDVVPSAKAGDYALGAIAWGLGLNGTNDPDDCMCGWSNNCDQNDTPCTLSGSLPTTGALDPETACPNLATQNAQQAFDVAFCQ